MSQKPESQLCNDSVMAESGGQGKTKKKQTQTSFLQQPISCQENLLLPLTFAQQLVFNKYK